MFSGEEFSVVHSERSTVTGKLGVGKGVRHTEWIHSALAITFSALL